MKRILVIPLMAIFVSTLMSHTNIRPIGALAPVISPKTAIDSVVATQDTSVSVIDTLREVEIKAKKGLKVVDVINQGLKNGPTQPRQKSISDIIGSKANDYIMHPFAWRERRKEKNLKKTKENLQRLDKAKSYEDELTEAINRQLREDSIAEARKKAQQETHKRMGR